MRLSCLVDRILSEVRVLPRARPCLLAVPRCASTLVGAKDVPFCRSFSTTATHSSGSKLVDSVNHALERYPVTTALVYLYHNTAYASATYILLLAAGIDGPRELGLSLVINRLTQRLRMPIIFAAAAALVRTVPAFGRLQLSKLMMAPFADLRRIAGPEPVLWDPQPQPSASASAAASTSAAGTPAATAVAAPSASTWQAMRDQWQLLRSSLSASSSAGQGGSAADSPSSPSSPSFAPARVAARGVLAAVNALNMGGVLDKFGLAYVLCGRAIASTQLIAVAYAIRAGVDVDAALAAVTASADAMLWQPVAGVLQEHVPAAYEWLAPHFNGSGSSATSSSGIETAAAAPDGTVSVQPDGATVGSASAEPLHGAAAAALEVHELPQALGDAAAGAGVETSAAAPSSASPGPGAGTGPGTGSGLLTTAAGWMSRWALGCLIMNAGYPLVLRYGVAGVAEWIGPRAAVVQQQAKLTAMAEEAKAAEAAEAAEQKAELERQRGKDGSSKPEDAAQPEAPASAAKHAATDR